MDTTFVNISDSDIAGALRTARLRALFQRLPEVLAISVVAAAAAAAVVVAHGGSAPATWLWLGLVLAVAGLRLVAWAAFRRDPDLVHAARWQAVALAGALASGLLWGIGAGLVPQAGAAGTGWVAPAALLLLGALCAGAATVQSVHVPAALSFILAACLPLAAQLAGASDARSLALAAAVLLYAAMMAVVARRSGGQFTEGARLRIALEQRTAALDAANAALRAEIADHRATGETLRQAQRMEAIGQLTGGVAHDFNNVLAVIGGSLQLIGRRSADNPDIQRLVAAAERAAGRGARLTGSLLSFAREQRLRPEVVDLCELVREFTPMLRRLLDGRMELTLDLPATPLIARTDPAQFQAALMHLAINSRDASPPGRRLTISAGTVATAPPGEATDHAGPFACIRVRDTGPGMAPEVAARAFEPFFTTKEVGQGSGLGLAQVYGFARQSGGLARIERPEGDGAAVVLLLPAAEAPQREPQPAPGMAGRVLLVEDDAEVREVLRESLAASGWEVMPAADGQAARQVLEGDAALDIVVSDVVMPGEISGVDLARTAARLRPELPVLLISGYPSATLAAQGADEGELNLMRKPFTHAELLARMREARPAARAAGG